MNMNEAELERKSLQDLRKIIEEAKSGKSGLLS
jgi:hypothetical protein